MYEHDTSLSLKMQLFTFMVHWWHNVSSFLYRLYCLESVHHSLQYITKYTFPYNNVLVYILGWKQK